MRLKAAFLIVADAYAGATGMRESMVSRMLFGGGNRIRNLRPDGRGMASCRIEDALQALSDHWPAGVEWPNCVSRPDPSPSPASATPDTPAGP